jgi:hypothetical protein
MVAGAKALLEFDRTDPRDRMVSVVDARAELERRLDVIEDHRRQDGQTCPACGGIVAREEGRGVLWGWSEDLRAEVLSSTEISDGDAA